MENSTQIEKVTQDLSSNQSVFSVGMFDQAQRIAKMLCSSSLVPKEFQNNVQNTLIALELATRMKASPLMIMQNLYVVYGKPGFSSKFLIAAINSSGKYPKGLKFETNGEGDKRGCLAWALDQDGDRIEGIRVDIAMAIAEGWMNKNGSKWKTMPDVMLQYRAASFFSSMNCPEITMGIQSQEEIIDITHSDIESQEQKMQFTPEDLQKLLDEKVAMLNKTEFDNAKRIIGNKEESSYNKLFKFLTEKTDEQDSKD